MSNETPITNGIADKKQIGTSALAKDLMTGPLLSMHFALQQDMIKFAVCVALSNHLDPELDRSDFDNSQRTSDLDSDGSLKFLVESYKGATETPYRMIESLAEAGFRHMSKVLTDDQKTLEFFIQDPA